MAGAGRVTFPCGSPSTLFEKIVVKINEQCVLEKSNYHLENYIMNRLTTTTAQKKYLRDSQMYMPDDRSELYIFVFF